MGPLVVTADQVYETHGFRCGELRDSRLFLAVGELPRSEGGLKLVHKIKVQEMLKLMSILNAKSSEWRLKEFRDIF